MTNPYENKILRDIIQYRPSELDNINVFYDNNKRSVTCFCGASVSQSILPHLKDKHAPKWQEWKELFLKLANLGFPPKVIMQLFCAKDGKLLFSWSVVEKNIRDEVESGGSLYSPVSNKRITRWEPKEFSLEKTTVWDFPKRGDWAVHQGDYRGNWPPQIPRNLIKKYTKIEDCVLDIFAGGGTSLIEAWLLNRRSIGLDISKFAIQNIKSRLNEMSLKAGKEISINLNPIYRPIVIEGNSLNLSKLLKLHSKDENKIRLVCVHPPYLDSVKYSNSKDNLGSIHDIDLFCNKIQILAREIKKVISADGVCAILIGDVRKNNKTIPLGFRVLNSFISESFDIENIIIKTQHRDKSSEFWVGHKSEITLMAHEYLFILKPQNGPH